MAPGSESKPLCFDGPWAGGRCYSAVAKLKVVSVLLEFLLRRSVSSDPNPLALLIFMLVIGPPALALYYKGQNENRRKREVLLDERLARKYPPVTFRYVAGWTELPVWVGATANHPKYAVDLESYSCSCLDWTEMRSTLPERHIGRCCKHILEALRQQQAVLDRFPIWAQRVIYASHSYAVRADFEHALFSNGDEEFLVLYDKACGYMQVFSSTADPRECIQFGLELYEPGEGWRPDHWGGNARPPLCVALKKQIRPWAIAHHTRYRDHQRQVAERRWAEDTARRQEYLASKSTRKADGV